MEVTIAGTKLKLLKGDITTQKVEAIVNAANTGLWGGSGVDGAIHRVGGPAIAEECRRIREEQGGCPTGQAVITTGGLLPTCYVVHTVGPIWRSGDQGEDKLLSDAYYNSLKIAQKNKIKSIAFPSISTGAYRFPLERAARIALDTIKTFLLQNPSSFNEVRIVLYTTSILEIYKKALMNLLEKEQSF
ncbi:MAG: O-acetyl-ADP-ribose deacetylase [Clostridia bacterium]|nr:O-acetyl-ADP-ribose deacetylase [Clostridia bacterium]